MTLNELLPLLDGVTGSGKQYSARCPAHDDKRASLSISEGTDGKILLNCHAGCAYDDIIAALGLQRSDLFQQPTAAQDFKGVGKAALVAEYVYTDLNGVPVAKKLRYSNKAFCWLKPDGAGWTKGRGGQAPLFNWFHVKDKSALYIVEGEKDVLTLGAYGKAAVSLPDGAKSKWLPEYGDYFKGKSVAIIEDHDEPGKAFAQTVAEKLNGVAATVRVIDLSKMWTEIPEHGDITDYVESHTGTDLHELTELVNATEVWTARPGADKLVSLSGVQTLPAEWLWYPYIPLGKITLITADPGTGKTFFSLHLASAVSTGRPFYGQMAAQVREPRTVIYQTAEDGIADTIKPRLEPMQPNFHNIFVIDETNETLSLQKYEEIEAAMKRINPALMIFDPLQAYLGADIDMHRANEVRPILARIGQLAEKYHCAVIFIMHNSKMSQNKALHRAIGSIDIPAIARSMLILGNNPEDPQQKVVCHEKSSLAPHGKSIMFRINPDFGGVVFDGFSDLQADDILNVHKGTRNKPSICKDEVQYRLAELIGEKGYARLDDIKALQEECGCGKDTLYRAKEALRLTSKTYGFSKNKVTYWIAPGKDLTQFEGQMQLS